MVAQILIKGLIKHLEYNRKFLHVVLEAWVNNHFHEIQVIQEKLLDADRAHLSTFCRAIIF